MPSVLVAHSYFLRFDPKQAQRARPYPPLATLQVAALLQGLGHEVQVFDAMLADGVDEFAAQLAGLQPAVVLLYEDNYNYLSKMCLARMREAALTMIRLARAGGAQVIAAGSDVSDAPEVYLGAGAAAACRGEGLDVIPTLIQRLAAAPGLDAAALVQGLDGALAWHEDRLLRGEPQAVVQMPAARRGSDALEAPVAWELVDVARYRRVWQAAHGQFSLNMAASKGCSFRCAWCAKPIWGQRYQQRSAEAVAAEMLMLQQRFAPDHIWFADDIFGFRADWVERFADALDRRGGGLPFTIQTRADLVSDAMAQALSEAGCREVWLGAESGSQAVLDAMHKGMTVADILRARERLRAVGVRVGFFIQLGYLGEGLPELLQTVDLVRRARPDAIGVSVSYPLPGTPFHAQVQAQLGAKTHWDHSADLAMMFQGSFGTAFYREVRELLHAEVEWQDPAARAALPARWQALLAQVAPAEALT